ncbi:UDP-N-acetylglucosamine 2-epimerase (non-hydrolyzing) [Selenomonas caprae]|uniref:UDP-N-acetylglucosamine 2-epimerase (Non-hydrolyzing) n=1 Tax=Selenomonas caprae TaxID=2606905 RepID=A0A5D6WMI6_9FIRM|nr:UDP-N-acetylglucosamine 2-epimerase (non-hydrolyzing) [Selenomonas caprae]TYZ29113.1 UDP-N-acetylglucosamine 2-epimerase (non-hydrolyzing) [Selenomonas caprae]
MKILTVVGARPQFIKAAVVSHVLRGRHQEVLVHTGQHFDYNMSQQFFDELDIPAPDYNLGVSGGSHGEMTGRMLIEIEKVLTKEQPDWLLLYGDTNSTIAAALAAAKLHIPICHVEAGTRTHSRTNPEEINRICTDHVSALLLASTASGMEEMKLEGLADRADLVGDPMYDAFLEYSGHKQLGDLTLQLLDGSTATVPDRFVYLTCHREENTNRDEDLREIFKAMEQLDYPVIYPVHPRNHDRALRLQEEMKLNNILLAQPVGYLESACLVKNAQLVVTDSGGLQREAFFAKKKCVTLLNFVVWPETMVGNRNVLAKPVAEDILEKIAIPQEIDESYQPFGDGHAALKIVEAMENVQGEK